MKLETLLPGNIRVMTRDEAVMYVNEAHPGTASAILAISPSELPFPFVITEWNGVREARNLRIPSAETDSRNRPIPMDRSLIRNNTLKDVADFVLGIAGGKAMNPINELVIVAYARHPATETAPGYLFDMDASAEICAYSIAAAIADWATGSDARSYYGAKGICRINQVLYDDLLEMLSGHEPSRIDMPII